MARKTTPLPQTYAAELTPEQMKLGIERLEKRLEAVQRFEPTSVTEQFNAPHVDSLAADIDDALTRTFGHGTIEYRRYQSAASFDHGPIYFGSRAALSEVHNALSRSKDSSIALLRQAIESLKERLAEIPAEKEEPNLGGSSARNPRKVFLVHGHDQGAKDAVARFLEKIELDAIILHEQPDKGLTIIEKFEECAKQVGFAVVLLTPDDLGGLASAPNQSSRARQNVVFELGYFVGNLGRGRACLLRKGDVEIPSDLYGVIYTEIDAADGWKLKLLKELKAAGLQFDANKVWE